LRLDCGYGQFSEREIASMNEDGKQEGPAAKPDGMVLMLRIMSVAMIAFGVSAGSLYLALPGEHQRWLAVLLKAAGMILGGFFASAVLLSLLRMISNHRSASRVM